MGKYKFTAIVWVYNDLNSMSANAAGMKGVWYFVTLPKKVSKDIKLNFADQKRGWGSLPVNVTIGKTNWRTSIFPDKKLGSYLLPIKKGVRSKEGIKNGDKINLGLAVAPL